VRAALARLVASADFPASPRNRRFLAYVVDKLLTGSLEEISGYHVATLVFGRSEDFNPTTDPIVRIEAGKLRRDLEIYYLKGGRQERVRIEIPRGSYVPTFRLAGADAAATANGQLLDLSGITVYAMSGDEGLVQDELRTHVIDGLTRSGEVAVYAAAVGADSGRGLLDSDTVRHLGQRNATRFILAGQLSRQGNPGAFTARLYDGATGQQLWVEDVAGHENNLAQSIVSRVVEVRRVLCKRLNDSPRILNGSHES